MITNEFAEASAEINEILGYLPSEYVEKIPKSFIELKTNFIKDKESDGLYWMIKIKDAQEFEIMYKLLECIWHE